MRGTIGKVLLILAALALSLVFPLSAAHADSIDPLGNNGGSEEQSTPSPSKSEEVKDSTKEFEDEFINDEDEGGEKTEAPSKNDNKISDDSDLPSGNDDSRSIFKGYDPLGDFDPSQNPIANMLLNGLGWLTSLFIWAVVAWFFLQTAIDLLYINAPWIRPFMADANEDGQGNSMPGFGGGSVGSGGFGVGGANQTAQKRAFMNRQWASDEAISAVKLLGGSSQTAMGGGGMAFGAGGMGAMGAMPEQDNNTRKSVMGDYVRARVKVMILLGIAIVLLTTSALLGFGMDIGTLLLKGGVYLINQGSAALPTGS